MGRREYHVGGKAHALARLQQLGCTTPRFITVSPEQIRHVVHGDLDGVLKLPLAEARRSLEEIRRHIDDESIATLSRHILAETASFPEELIIRSSALGEDGPQHSFAGIFTSARTTRDAGTLAVALRAVIEGWCSDRVLFYLDAKHIERWPALCIMVQEYLVADVGGVAFSTYNHHGRDGVYLNSSADPQDVVDGRPCDATFVDGEVVQAIHGSQLSHRIALDVAQTARKIERAFGAPQDVEWLIRNNALVILQSRPITTAAYMRIWDNSNIAESYSGVVLPLTISFCRDVYRTVYVDVARTSGVPEDRIRANDHLFGHLLGTFKGRIYYNMLNWYAMLTLFPGYARNKRNLDTMISARSKADLDAQYSRNVPFSFKTKYYALNSYRYMRFQRDMARFHRDMRKEFQEFAQLPVERMQPHESLALYYRLKRDVLGRWSITVDNDFLLMTFFGMLRKRHPEDLFPLIADVGAISAAQVHALHKLAQEFHKHPELVEAAERPQHCFSLIADARYAGLRRHIDEYLDLYQGRFGSELKLETDIEPWHLIEQLRSYASLPQKSHRAAATPHGLFTRYLVRKVKFHAAQREESRLLRAQAFNCARRIFKSIGMRFTELNVIDAPQDIFYLQTEEIEQYIEGSSVSTNLRDLIIMRKQEYLRYAQEDIDGVMSTSGIPSLSVRHRSTAHGTLAGNGCSPGRVSGTIRVLHACDITKISRGDILVASRTDPGWTPLFGICAGVIVEHGGILSHAAIISRELGIPCIVDARGAMAILKDGQRVTMDGGSGEIIV